MDSKKADANGGSMSLEGASSFSINTTSSVKKGTTKKAPVGSDKKGAPGKPYKKGLKEKSTKKQQHLELKDEDPTNNSGLNTGVHGTQMDLILDLKEEDVQDFSDLNIQEIINHKVVPDIYADACKILGIVPVSRISNKAADEELILRYYGLGSLGAEAFSKILKVNETWRKVDLTGNWIESGGLHIFKSMGVNRTLNYLDLSNNRLGGAGIITLSEILPTSKLTHLLLAGNYLSDPECEAIAVGMKGNNTIFHLDLSNNCIGDIGVIALGSALANNISLDHLNLSWNTIRSRGVAGFLAAMRDNSTLQELHMEGCGVGDGGNAIGAWLAKSSGIQLLNLNRTRCSDAGISAIAKGIDQNCKLDHPRMYNYRLVPLHDTYSCQGNNNSYTDKIREFWCSYNPFTDNGAFALFKGLSNCSSIKLVQLQGIRLSKDGRTKMAALKEEKGEGFSIME